VVRVTLTAMADTGRNINAGIAMMRNDAESRWALKLNAYSRLQSVNEVLEIGRIMHTRLIMLSARPFRESNC
jgi:hypothetical protein